MIYYNKILFFLKKIKLTSLCFLFYFLIFISPFYLNANPKLKKPQNTPKSVEKEFNEEVKTNFDEIKEFLSYDPATGKWSKIKDFETVKIMKKKKPDSEDIPKYIYQNFWAFDEKKGKWYEVNISEIGYIPPPFAKWKLFAQNLCLDFSIGAEVGYNKIIPKGKNIAFLTTIYGEIWITDKNYNGSPFQLKFLTVNQSKDKNKIYSVFSKTAAFYYFDYLVGISYQIPLTLSLHYTFKKTRIRLGLGNTFVLNFTNTYKPIIKKDPDIYLFPIQKKIKTPKPFSKSPNLILRPFLLFGWILNKNLIHHAIIDTRFGFSIYPSQSKIKNTLVGGYGNIGLGYEKRMGKYLKAKFRIGTGFEIFNIFIFEFKENSPYFDKKVHLTPVNGNILSYMVPSVFLEVGIGSYFAKDKKVEKELKKINLKRYIKRKEKIKKAEEKSRRKYLKNKLKKDKKRKLALYKQRMKEKKKELMKKELEELEEESS